MSEYGFAVEVEDAYDDAVIRTRLALRAEGFSIITEMHVGGMLGPEAGRARQYLIMGAWAAPSTERDVTQDLKVAVHLPCNVIVQETPTGAMVAAMDPTEAVDAGDDVTARTAEAARSAVTRALQTISRPPA